MIFTWRMLLSLILIILSSVRFIICPETETTTPDAVQASAGSADTSVAKQPVTVECSDKQQATPAQNSSNTGDCCVFLKSLRWLVTEPVKYLWKYMVATKNILVNLTSTYNSGNTVRINAL
ncbi:uncharacterized protein LOC112685824 [Sipha flava]|uniref:Uncharacterized protein LOC112685824 n=1 Tax=Sipha flava TaxID=143950 RepID=A0A2S2Q029_9HEMI|nr:uncharacterized protein LOC112685824 [Sipha flava]XP_025413631.1 uncharacterized protein LOC112685824 [Sipha flava]